MVINTFYLDDGMIKSARKVYLSQAPNNIRLDNFFQKSIFLLLQNKLHESQYKIKFHPYRHKYCTTKSKEIDSFIKGRYFGDLIKKMLHAKKFEIEYEIRKFEPGNYTLLHDAEKERSGIDFVIDFSKSSEAFGGQTIYLSESEELLILKPSSNTLSFVKRDKGTMKYTKYLTHQRKHPMVQAVGIIFKK